MSETRTHLSANNSSEHGRKRQTQTGANLPQELPGPITSEVLWVTLKSYTRYSANVNGED